MSIANDVIGSIPRPLIENDRIVFIESTLAFLVGWYVVSHALGVTDLMSDPVLVGVALYELVLVEGGWFVHVAATMRRILLALAVTMAVGTVFGVLMGWYEFWAWAFRDWVVIGLAAPTLIAAIFAGMWFGFTDLTPIAAGTVIAFPFVTQNVFEGINDLDNRLIEMAVAYDVPREEVLKKVVLKGVLPYWFAGLRYGFAICWKVTALTETVVSEKGMGFQLRYHMDAFSMTGVAKWTVLFAAIILFVEYGVFQTIEDRLFEWRRDASVGFAGA